MSVLALVPARIGSKRLPKKNIKILSGKPLIAWTIEAAKKSKYINKIVVSTDDIQISKISKKYGAEVPFIRPAEISGHDAQSIDVALHALSNLPKFEWLLFLQPTSPLRSEIDIDNIFEFCQINKASSAASVYKLNIHGSDQSFNSKLMYIVDKNFRLNSTTKSDFDKILKKDFSNIHCLNGAIFLVKTDWLIKNKTFINEETVGFVMPKKRSIDIDTIEDWNFVEKTVEGLDG
jgi:CMP-N,N'-diacetyllegionaminic acid synthase